MSNHVTVYCDESGNDGPNYLNKDTPFYVLAGWVVPDETIVDAMVAIEQVRQAEFQQQIPELHFRLFDRNDRRRTTLGKLFEQLGKLKLTPVYVLAEKRYCVAGKIVETFLDPAYNELAKNGMTWNISVKQEIANTLYDRLPDPALHRFAHAYRAPTQKDLAEALAEVEAACVSCVNPELAKFFHGSHASLDEIAADEIQANATWGKGGGTLNFPCLISFIMMIEQMGRSELFTTKKIVHDEQTIYEETYRAAFQHYKNLDNVWMTLPGADLGQGSLTTVNDFETQRSIDQPLIQAADVLSGAINSLCISLIHGKGLSPGELEIAQQILTPMLFRGHKIAFPICSDRMLTKIGEAIRKSFPEFKDDPDPAPYKKGDSRGLPVLPPRQTRPEPESGLPKLRIDLPIYGIVFGAEERLISLSYSESNGLIDENDVVVPLFTQRCHADVFLAENQPFWDEPHKVRCFHVPELGKLLQQLAEFADIAVAIEFDRRGLMKIREFIDGLQQVLDRTAAAVQTGAMGVLFEKHSIDGIEVVSLLLSSGEYGAMNANGGEVLRAATRQEAVEAVVAVVSHKSTG